MSDPMFMAVAGALAGKAAVALASSALGSLYQFVKERLARRAEDTLALEQAEAAPDDERRVTALGATLERVAAEDPAFAERVRELWSRANTEARAETGGVVNQVNGTVHGQVIQLRDVQGGLHFGAPPQGS
ncbi:hypothetical protein LX15_003742 [Streptoalloteichus tenebrarius]|uniref:Uncharacterized protein n=1 Tax=Streptoalloteichus tenebrarius (strain ATCC 17920 / DSM 40477 / JCM 4838 / CBS 697.72 / NBRC 16177 / NCIMB 11028 / NRRL B-12390 / A12253. 1 / ISP 5477) TaxID=1933 RepID=A0ABT1HX04_STRSD|nr:hypothetical protein [Streptoalloteichus tenebrarius]MCP2260031.1 hypothetical protein [Streptoalloteichus tenebrarius]BFF03853.1 hypothetical protein GCM10020241_55280 [Streptoalloteichus tenebrarius]